MPKVKQVANQTSGDTKKHAPPKTPEARESQMISLAMNLVEQRLRNGTATSQETTHFLKLAADKETEQLRKQLMETQIELAKAKAKAYTSAEEIKELYKNAMQAFTIYSGHDEYDGR